MTDATNSPDLSDPIPAGFEYPLSLQQRRLWFYEQLQPGTPAYNVPRAIRLRGPLDRDALGRALQSLVNRHETLRTTFQSVDEQPTQRVNATSPLRIPIIDLHTDYDDDAAVESTLRLRMSAEARMPFDLSRDLMLRAVLYQTAIDEHVLLLTFHHLACDGWSLRILFRELSAAYEAFCRGEESPATDPPDQYMHVAVRQDEGTRTQLIPRIAWWQQKLSGAPKHTEFPTDHPRPAAQGWHGAHEPFDIPTSLLERIDKLSRDEGTTRFRFLMTSFLIVLHRWTSESDIVIGSALSGRRLPEARDVVGFFVETVALRADLSGDPTIRELLARVDREFLDVREHGSVPFDRVVEATIREPDLSRHPIFQFSINAPPRDPLNLIDLETTPVAVNLGASRHDLEFTYSNGANRPTEITYSTELFDRSTIRRFVDHILLTLETMVKSPDVRLSATNVLPENEQHRLRVEWNATTDLTNKNATVVDLIQLQVASDPHAVAIAFEGRELTYQELSDRSDQLAQYLCSQDVGPDSLVGLCIERSPEVIVSILAILKVGAAYLPLDARHPKERIEFMVQDARVGVLLTESHLVSRLPKTQGRITCLDTLNLEGTRQTRLDTGAARADRLAYVMYTSGSTGKPKGVSITHGNLTNLLISIRSTLGLNSQSRMLGIASPTFDISVAEMFLPLVSGGTTILVSAETAQDVTSLAETLETTRPEIAQATPATWRMLVDAGWQGDSELTLISTGEALPRALATDLLPLCGTLYDFYGPTETTIWSTVHRVDGNDHGGLIGRPIRNTKVYVLDSRRKLCPIGVPGELYIGGAGVARGYLNRPELTAGKFVSNAFNDEAAPRLYRTGDIVRWRDDGNLEYFGRIDNQIKLRGYRIELGEIESALNEHEMVTQSVVQLREDEPGEQRLVAYFVPVSNPGPTPAVLRNHLRSRLPDYMLPASFVTLDRFPLTSSGKIDGRALPLPDDSRPELERGYVEPRDDAEQRLAQIWGKSLKIDRVGIYDNFFALGGHSLLATQVNARISEAFNINLPLRALFESPTIADLALKLSTGHKTQRAPAPSSLSQGHFLSVLRKGSPRLDDATTGTIVCVGGNVIEQIARMPEESPVLHLAIDGVQVQPYLGLSIPELSERYADELLSFSRRARFVLLGYSYGGVLAIALAHILRSRNIDYELVLIEPTISSRLRAPRSLLQLSTKARHFVSDPKSYMSPLYHSLTSTIDHESSRLWAGLRVATGQSITGRQRWRYRLKAIHRNIRAYQPQSRLEGTAHLVCGTAWLQGRGAYWIDQFLLDTPVIHDVGDIPHLELMRSGATVWLDVVRHLVYGKMQRYGYCVTAASPGDCV